MADDYTIEVDGDEGARLFGISDAIATRNRFNDLLMANTSPENEKDIRFLFVFWCKELERLVGEFNALYPSHKVTLEME